MPGVSTQEVPADRRVEMVVDPWVILLYQNLHTHTLTDIYTYVTDHNHL